MVYENSNKSIKIIYPERNCLCGKRMKIVAKNMTKMLGVKTNMGYKYSSTVHYKCEPCNKWVYMRYNVEEEIGE